MSKQGSIASRVETVQDTSTQYGVSFSVTLKMYWDDLENPQLGEGLAKRVTKAIKGLVITDKEEHNG